MTKRRTKMETLETRRVDRATRDPVSAAASARDGDAMCPGTAEGDGRWWTGAPGRYACARETHPRT